ncbi:MAG: hypothetical protein K0S11_1576 [Gammaproteobacteria bacterium]|jgi:hypothetical protein|nr:hypothetical protein [Gammaproteobacteria bacterium]
MVINITESTEQELPKQQDLFTEGLQKIERLKQREFAKGRFFGLWQAMQSRRGLRWFNPYSDTVKFYWYEAELQKITAELKREEIQQINQLFAMAETNPSAAIDEMVKANKEKLERLEKIYHDKPAPGRVIKVNRHFKQLHQTVKAELSMEMTYQRICTAIANNMLTPAIEETAVKPDRLNLFSDVLSKLKQNLQGKLTAAQQKIQGLEIKLKKRASKQNVDLLNGTKSEQIRVEQTCKIIENLEQAVSSTRQKESTSQQQLTSIEVTLKQQIAELEARHRATQKKAEQEIAKLQEELTKKQAGHGRKEKTWQNEKESLENLNAEYELNCQRLINKASGLQTQNKQLRDKCSQLEEQLLEEQQKNSQLQQENEQLRQRLTGEQPTKLKSQASVKMALEALQIIVKSNSIKEIEQQAKENPGLFDKLVEVADACSDNPTTGLQLKTRKIKTEGETSFQRLSDNVVDTLGRHLRFFNRRVFPKSDSGLYTDATCLDLTSDASVNHVVSVKNMLVALACRINGINYDAKQGYTQLEPFKIEKGNVKHSLIELALYLDKKIYKTIKADKEQLSMIDNQSVSQPAP